jgi:hypothetical protein
MKCIQAPLKLGHCCGGFIMFTILRIRSGRANGRVSRRKRRRNGRKRGRGKGVEIEKETMRWKKKTEDKGRREKGDAEQKEK